MRWPEFSARVTAITDTEVLRAMLKEERARPGGPRKVFERRLLHRLSRLAGVEMLKELGE